jgi:hypothetical protein
MRIQKNKLAAIAGLGLALAPAAQAATVVGDWTVIDNSETADSGDGLGYHTSSTPGGQTGGSGNYWIGDMDWYTKETHDDAPGVLTMTWLFTGLTPGTYEVVANWQLEGNRATDAPYSINGGPSILINQQAASTGTTIFGTQNTTFQTLDAAVTVAGTSFTVVLTNDADGFVIADAVAIRQLTAVPEPSSDPEITSITSLGGGVFELKLKGENSTSYQFFSSTTLDFDTGTLVPLTAILGGGGGTDVTTTSSGDATVQMSPGGSANFVRAVGP